ncbi:MAG TPA: hypothetical protein VME23_04650 [Terracidiphilus sp.]|nr:hypothetical protein [Terracidiphilus sp.]
MRIPERSIIAKVFAGETKDDHATEDLSWWESSDGGKLQKMPVEVQLRSGWDGVRALITPA